MLDIDRSSTTGYDLVLDESNYFDIAVNSQGDIETVFGTDSLIQSLIRRALTPTGGFARYTRNGEGEWKAIGVGFGNRLSFYLSQPNPDLDSIQEEVQRALDKDSRIDIRQINVEGRNPIQVDIQYQFQNERAIRSESLNLG